MRCPEWAVMDLENVPWAALGALLAVEECMCFTYWACCVDNKVHHSLSYSFLY